jgi:FSR family fosmidomycin resistance protein-like MFS transporter
LVGIIADSFNLKYLVVFTPAVTAICMSLLGIAPSYAILAILIFLSGISSGLFHIPSPVMIKRLSGKRVSSGMGFYMFGGEMARTLGPLLITAAIAQWGLEGSVRVMPLGILASAFLFYKLKDVDFFTSEIKKKKNDSAKVTIKKLLPFFSKLGLFLLFRAGLKGSLTVFLTTYLVKEGESLWFAGIALSILQFSGAVSTVATGFLAEKIGCRNSLVLSSVCTPLMMLLFIAFPAYRIFTLILIGFFLFMPGPVILTLVQNTDSERPAFVNSVYMTINFTISALMVMAVGYVGDLTSLAQTYKIFVAVSLLAIPISFFLKQHKSPN